MPMNFSIPAEGLIVRTGAERVTLVKRTYLLVLAGAILTVAGTAFAFTQPALLAAVAQHQFITFLCTFAPLLLATRVRAAFPANILLVLALGRPLLRLLDRYRDRFIWEPWISADTLHTGRRSQG